MSAGERIVEIVYRLRRLLQAHWLVLPLIALLLYFVYHGIHGRRGLQAWIAKEQELAQVRAELERLEREQARWQRRVRALEPGKVDGDLLESELRRLGYLRPGEVVVLDPRGADGPGEEAK